MVVALTFDAGSDAGSASAILDVLATNGVPATFGLTGRWADANPALVRRIVADGHQVVNHSYDHPSFTGYSTGASPLPRTERLDQLARADAAIRAAGGASTAPWFRPPYGDDDATVRADVGSVGYRYELMWTVDSLGWKGLPAADVLRRCLDGAEPGAIYLMHVGIASTDHAALQDLIDGLRVRGYGFATAAGLIEG
jgi:peptidoglycan/xylan/chitin deacetylase (PgdA/CDA1 family)